MKKTRWESAGTRTLRFVVENIGKHVYSKASGKEVVISVPPGLPKNSIARQPTIESSNISAAATRSAPDIARLSLAGKPKLPAGFPKLPANPAPAPNAQRLPPVNAPPPLPNLTAPTGVKNGVQLPINPNPHRSAPQLPSGVALNKAAPPPIPIKKKPAPPPPKQIPKFKVLFDYQGMRNVIFVTHVF